MKYGANPMAKENYEVGQNTPMHLAAELNMVQVLDQLFIGNGADASILNKAGQTCLHIAAREGHLDMCNMLVTRGCLPEIQDKFGFTASYWAHQKGHSDIVKILPPPKKITKEEYYEHIKLVWETHGFKPGGKKGKKGKGKKKKWEQLIRV